MSQISKTSKLPPEVYRRRRIAALVAFVLVIALIWGLVSFIGSLFSTPQGETAFPEDVPGSSVVVESGEPCPPGTVIVEALVGNSEGKNILSFKPEDTPYLWFTLTNTTSVDCTFNAGAKVQFFSIQSGEQLIWTSKNCDRRGLEDGDVVLKAGATISSPPQPWEKVFSGAEGCGADQKPVVTGGASYHLKVEVNGELSSNSQQFVLN
jgi:hypothetical protein